MSEIPRDPEQYYLSDHAYTRLKGREIDHAMIVETIQEGTIKQSHKDDCVLFIQEFWFADEPVGVVANHVDGEIITVEWRK